MKVGIFIPCYVNQFYPQVGIATLTLLEKLGVHAQYPLNQTCCGQPMANAGYERYGKETARLFVDNFRHYDYIIAPSGSCVYHVRKHFDIIDQSPEVVHVRENTLELCEFLVKVLKQKNVGAVFPYRVGLHQSCHGLRGLRLGKDSEQVVAHYSVVEELLGAVKGLELVSLQREDECCGFGGTFAVTEDSVSVKMGNDRLADHHTGGAQVITGTDVSCLMHLEGLAKRQKQSVRFMHVAEILNTTTS